MLAMVPRYHDDLVEDPSLIPVVDSLRGRFSIGRVCVVADRGMISQEVIRELEAEQRDWLYILGGRLRRHEGATGAGRSFMPST